MKYTLAILVLTLNFNIARADQIRSDQSQNGYAGINDLSGALTETYNSNPEIRKARADFESTAELRSQAFSNYLPTVTASFDYGKQHSQLENTKDNGIVNNKSLNAEQPLFRGENAGRMGQSENLSKAAMFNLKNVEQETFLAAITAYTNLMTDDELLKIADAKEKLLFRQYEETGKRFKGGELTKTDVSQSISRASQSDAEVSTFKANYAASRANFVRIVGKTPQDNLAPVALPQIPASIDIALEEAKANDPAVKSTEYAEKAANELVDANIGSIMPSLSLRGRLDREDNYALASNGDYINDSVTVNLTVPLYQSGSEYSKVRQAKADASARRYEHMAAISRSEEQVRAIWERIYTISKVIDSSQMAVDAANMALDGVKKEERLGTRSVLDVLDAEQELFAAKSRLLSAKRDQVIAYYTLEARIGRLTAKELQLPVEFYDPEKHYDDVKNKFIGF